MAGSLTKQGGLTGGLSKPETLKGNLANPHLRGYSAYEVAVENGFEGTEEEWLESLKGQDFTYEDFTEEQLDSLKGDKGDPFVYDDFTDEQLELLKVKGDTGKSAYEVWLDEGNKGTEQDFLNSLKGETNITSKSIADVLGYVPADVNDVDNLSKDVEELKEKEIDLTGYATENYVQSYAQPKGDYAALKHTHSEYLTEHQDLKDYAKKSDIPTDYARSEHKHDQYLTSIPNEYVTESELANKKYLTSIPSEYITESELSSKGYLTEHQSLTDYAKKSELPTKTSQLENDSGFLTKDDNVVVDLSEYSTTEQNDAKYQPKGDYSTIGHTHSEYLTEHQDISNLAKKDELHSHNNKSVLDNISQENIDNWNNKSDFSGSYNDLTNKPTIPTKVSELDNDSNFITSVPLEYVTETELSQKGYATESFVTNKIEEAELSGSDVDLSGLATKDELNNKVDKIKGKSLIDDTEIERLAGVVNYDDTEIKNQINSKADKTEIPSKVSQLENDKNYLTSVPNEYITENELNNKGYLTQHQSLTDYAKKTELPTKTSQLTNDSGYITSIPSEYVTKTELAGKKYLTSVPSEYITESELNAKGYITSVPQEVAVQNNQPTSSALWVDIDSTDEINLAEIDDNTVSDEKTWSSTKISREIVDLQNKQVTSEDISDLGFWKEVDGKEYVDNEINDLKTQGVQQTPLFANSIEEMTDTTKMYVLPDGYIYAYMKRKGELQPTFTNLFDKSNVYVNQRYVKNVLTDYKNQTGTVSQTAFDGLFTVHAIPIDFSDITVPHTIRVGNFPYSLKGAQATITPITTKPITDYSLYFSSSSYPGFTVVSSTEPQTITFDTSSYWHTASSLKTNIKTFGLTLKVKDTALTIDDVPDDLIITVDEPIEYEQGEDYYAWTNTGHAYQPTDYEDRIIALETDVDKLKYGYEGGELKTGIVRSINHRGYNTLAPENTLPAFKLSAQKGFKYVECDVRMTSDGIPVLLHDSTVDRTSNGTGNIADMTLATAKALDFGSWVSSQYTDTKIPTFEEFILLCRNLGLFAYVEIKTNTEACRTAIGNIVKKYGMAGNVSYLCSITETPTGLPVGSRIGFVSNTHYDMATHITNRKNEGYEVFFDYLYSIVNDDIVNYCVEKEIDLEVWTTNTEDAIVSANPYISGFTSDNLIAGNVLYNANIN